MNNDLISRSALKEVIKQKSCYAEYYPTSRILEEIDSAPTVDISKEVWNKSNELLEKRMKYLSRPHGKWIDHSDDYGYVECPFCHELTNCEGNPEELHYCWSCGAKLRKGSADMGGNNNGR